MGGVLDIIAPIAGGALGSMVGMPMLGAAVASGLSTGVKTGNPVAGLLSAGGSYLGSSVGSSLGSAFGASGGGLLSQSPGEALAGVVGPQTMGSIAPFGSWAGNALGSDTLGTLAGGALGGSVGNSMGTSLGQSINPMKPNTQDPAIYSPSRQSQMGLPQSLSQFGSLDPFQQATNIATKGIYGGGQGKDENSYFLNLINRQLVDPSGSVGGMQSLNPVENTYLSQLGLGGFGNSNDLLKGISQYSA